MRRKLSSDNPDLPTNIFLIGMLSGAVSALGDFQVLWQDGTNGTYPVEDIDFFELRAEYENADIIGFKSENVYTSGDSDETDDEYDEYGYDSEGYDEYGFDEDGYNSAGYDEDGFDRDGYDAEGYDYLGHDEDGYDSEGFDSDGFDENGLDANGFDEDGYDTEGYDEDGFDENGEAKPDNATYVTTFIREGVSYTADQIKAGIAQHGQRGYSRTTGVPRTTLQEWLSRI